MRDLLDDVSILDQLLVDLGQVLQQLLIPPIAGG